MKAQPVPDTIHSAAECRNCGDKIIRMKGGDWYHEYSGNPLCPS